MYLDYSIPCISRQLYASYVLTDFLLLNLVALIIFDDYVLKLLVKGNVIPFLN
jgi:hypothetical protein